MIPLITFFSQYWKKGALYASIGVFVVGGLYGLSFQTAEAYYGTVSLTSGILSVAAPAGKFAWVTATSSLQTQYDQSVMNMDYPIGIEYGGINGTGCTGGVGGTCPLFDTVSDGTWYVMIGYNSGGHYYDAMDGTDFIVVTPTSIQDFGDTTRFISVSPAYGSNVATGTVTIDVQGYISQRDLDNAGGSLQLTSVAVRQSPSAPQVVTTTVIDSAGLFDVIGTSTVNAASIYSDSFVLSTVGLPDWLQFISNIAALPVRLLDWNNPFGSGSATVIIATSTYFSVGDLSPFQENLFNQTIARHALDASTTAAYDLTTCNPLSGNFNVETCVYNMIVPSDAGMKEIADNAQAGFLMAAPWGYISRIMSMLDASTTEATSTIPVISYTFPSVFPVFGGMNVHFDVYGYMLQGASLMNNDLVSNTDGKNAWEIFGAIVNIIVGIVLFYKMLSDVTGVDFHSGSAQDTRVNGSTPDETYRYKEKLYAMSRRHK